MREVLNVSEQTGRRRWREIKTTLREDLTVWTRHHLKRLLEHTLEEEREVCLRAARQAFRAWAARWRPVAPTAVACLERDLGEIFNCFACPPGHRTKTRTTNAIERAFREVRRRVRPMTCFTNAASCDRIVYAVITHLNAQWERHPLKEFRPKS